MRTALNIGAGFCCVMAAFFGFRLALEVTTFWPDIPHNFASLFIALSHHWPLPVYMLLGVAPVAMLFQSRRVEKPRWRFAFIATTELIVVVAFVGTSLAMVFSAP